MYKKNYIKNTLGIKTIENGEFFQCSDATILKPGSFVITNKVKDANCGIPLLLEVQASMLSNFIIVGGGSVPKKGCFSLFVPVARKYAQRKSKQ